MFRQKQLRLHHLRRLFLERLEDRVVLAFAEAEVVAVSAANDLYAVPYQGLDEQPAAAPFYMADGERVDLDVLDGSFAVKLSELDAVKLLASMGDTGGQFEGFRVERHIVDRIFEVSIDEPAASLPLDNRIEWIVPAFSVSSTGTKVFVLDEVIVSVRSGNAVADLFGADMIDFRPLLGTADQFVVTLRYGGQFALNYANRLLQDHRVAWASPNLFQDVQEFFTPNDPLYTDQWHLNNTGSQVPDAIAGADVKAAAVWNYATGAGVTVAVLDDGIEITHPDLAENIFVNVGEIAENGLDDDGNGWVDDVSGWSFASHSPHPSVGISDRHGTSVAGVVAGRGNNGQGVIGAAWNAKILPVQIFNGATYVGDADTASAIYYAAGRTADGLGIWNAAQVLNCSWGGGSPNTAVTNAFTWASNVAREGQGVATFIASGNNSWKEVSYPARLSRTLSGVMAVGASNHRDERSEYSNYGVALDFVAPSSDILAPYTVGITTTDRTGSLGYNATDYTNNTKENGFGGTSSASPLAAGVGALMLSHDPTLTAAEVKQLLRSTSDKVDGVTYDANGFNLQYGYGRINAWTALASLDLFVATTTPAPDVILGTRPEIVGGYRVDFSSAISQSPSDILPSRVKVNGEAAIGYTIVDADTLQFEFAVDPITQQGLQSWVVEAGAVRRDSDGSPLVEYSGTFRYDVVPLAVTNTLPEIGATIVLPIATLDVRFNEPIKPSSLGHDDFAISQGTISGVELIDGQTVRLSLQGVVRETELVVEVGFGALTDLYDNPNLAFSCAYSLDFGDISYPAEFHAVAPLGSLIYQSDVAASIGWGGDVDTFFFDVDPMQTLTVAVVPSSDSALQPKVSVIMPSKSSESASAAGAGQAALLQAIKTEPDTGLYQVVVEGVDDTTYGRYILQITLNAIMEKESDDTLAEAHDLAASFVRLDELGSRGAALGIATLIAGGDGFESGDLNALPWTTFGDANWFVTDQGAASGTFSVRSGAIDHGQSSTLTLSLLTAAGNISFSRRLSTEGGGDGLRFLIDGTQLYHSSGEAEFYTLSYPIPAGMHTFTWVYAKNDAYSSGLDTVFIDDVVIPVPESDYFRFDLAQGETATIALTGLTGMANSFELQDAAGAVLAHSSPGTARVDHFITEFVAVAPGTNPYFIFTRPYVDYSLVVTKNSTFDLDANNSAAAAQDLSDSQFAWGYFGSEMALFTDGFETGDLTLLPWVSSGNQNWLVSSQVTAGGAFSARSGAISNDQTSTLSLTVTTGVGDIRFDKQVSANESQDFLNFFVDGTLMGTWSGIEPGFTNRSYPVLAGRHTFRWTYTKYSYQIKGLNAAFIDNVTFRSATTSADWYAITMEDGNSILEIGTRTPGDGLGLYANQFNPRIELYDTTGTTLIAGGMTVADGRNERIVVSGLTPGASYRIRVAGEQDTVGEYYLDVLQSAPPPMSAVVDRHIFYNDSAWDAHNAAANQDDDNAVAINKQPLLPDQLATLANYSTYSCGINGIMVDIAGLANPGGLSAADFEFRVGNTNDPSNWPLLVLDPSEISVAVRPGVGSLGSDRVTILFPDGVVENTWLQVTVQANATTGLVVPDVHYWGHMNGETGDVAGDTLVDSYDVAGVLANPRTTDNPASITDVYDFNRDRLVDAVDAAYAEAFVTTPNTMLRMLDLRTTGMPEITISASPGSVMEDGGTELVYTFTRMGDVSSATTVMFRVTGSAVVTNDYAVSGADSFTAKVGAVTFAAGSNTATVTIDPTADAVVECDETTWLSVLPDANNKVGAASHAAGTITSDDTLQATQAVIQEGTNQRSIITYMKVTFNANVAIAPGAFQIINRGSGQVLNFSVTTTVEDGKTTATLTFLAGDSVYARQGGYCLNDGNYQLTIEATKVTYLGLELDGNRDGTAGDDYVFGAVAADKFFRLFGDMDGDRDVDATDYGRLGLTYRKIAGQTGYNRFLDYDGDGDVDATDYGRFSLRYRKVLAF